MDLKYVRQRKARRIIAASGSACAGLATIIGVVALLAQRPGSFVVSVKNNASRLTLAHELAKSDEQVTYYNAGEVPTFVEYQNSDLNLYRDDILDNENFSYKTDARTGEGSIKFFACTFYVKNIGNVDAGYSLSLNFTNVSKSVQKGYDLDSILRVRFYENKVTNDENETHNYRVFAKQCFNEHHRRYDENGNVTYLEQISKEGSGFAEPFESEYVILSSRIDHIAPQEAYRYTFVFWLEGNDPECAGEPPVDSKLNMGVTIAAHEAE